MRRRPHRADRAGGGRAVDRGRRSARRPAARAQSCEGRLLRQAVDLVQVEPAVVEELRGDGRRGDVGQLGVQQLKVRPAGPRGRPIRGELGSRPTADESYAAAAAEFNIKPICDAYGADSAATYTMKITMDPHAQIAMRQ